MKKSDKNKNMMKNKTFRRPCGEVVKVVSEEEFFVFVEDGRKFFKAEAKTRWKEVE